MIKLLDKNRFSFLWRILFILLTLSSITACGGGTSTDSTGGQSSALATLTPPLANGSVVQSSSASFSASKGRATSGIIGLSGGSDDYAGVMTMAVNAVKPSWRSNVTLVSLPTITMVPSNCVLISGSPTQSSCEFVINVPDAVINGDYEIIPTFTPNNGGSAVVLSGVALKVTQSSAPVAGNLSILIDSNNLMVGESTTAVISLSNSSGVNDLPITISSSNNEIVTVSPTTCKLSTLDNSCDVILSGNATGSTTITAAASGYTSAQINMNVQIQNAYTTSAPSTNSGLIYMYSLNSSNGFLNSLTPPSLPTSTTGGEIIFDPSGKFAYQLEYLDYNAPQSSSITVRMFSVNSVTGQLAALNPAELTIPVANKAPDYNNSALDGISFDPTGNYAYIPSATRSGSSNNVSILMFKKNSQTGQLSQLTPASVATVAGATRVALKFGPTGKFVYLDTYIGYGEPWSTLMYSFNPNNGQLVLEPNATVQGGRIQFSPSGNYAYTTDTQPARIHMYSINQSNGILTALSPAVIDIPVSSGQSSTYPAFDPSGKFVYVGVGAENQSNNILMYGINQSTGLITPLSTLSVLNSIPSNYRVSWVFITPNGNYAYVVNADYNYRPKSVISMFKIDSSSGQLSPLSPAVTETSSYIWYMWFDPSGRFAYAGLDATPGTSIQSYKIDPNSGALLKNPASIPGFTLSFN